MLDTTVQPNVCSPEEPIRVALLVEYCGASFYGSQYQPDRPTVQEALQDALRRLNLSTSAVSFAGRTDAGVHALGQVAHFDVAPEALANIRNLPQALNAHLPETVSVRDAHVNTGLRFNSRREAAFKWYRYTIFNAPNRSVWAARNASLHHRKPLEAARMDEAARLILGTHDFKSFKDSDTHVTDDVCDIRHARVVRDGDTLIFDVVADRFLYKMVRNLVGQLMVIGSVEKPLPAETISAIMARRDRTAAAQTAPANGLALMAILYPSPYDFFGRDRYVRQLENIIYQPKLESLHHENLFRKAS